MKRSIIYSLFAGLLLFVGCRKEDNPKIPELTRTPTPLILKEAEGDGTISRDDPSAFQGKFSVDLYFKEDVKPQKFDVVVIKNDDKSKVLTIKEGVTTFPTSLTITGAELITLFNDSIRLGDKFTIGVDITMLNGQKLLAFSPVGEAYGAGVGNQPGASLSIDYICVCPFDINDFVGTFTLDDPGFWGTSYPVTITLEGEDTYKVSGFVEDPTYSIFLKVNIATQTITVDKQVYGPTLPTTPYTNPTTEGTGVIDACNKRIVLNLDHSVDQGSFDPSEIIIHK